MCLLRVRNWLPDSPYIQAEFDLQRNFEHVICKALLCSYAHRLFLFEGQRIDFVQEMKVGGYLSVIY